MVGGAVDFGNRETFPGFNKMRFLAASVVGSSFPNLKAHFDNFYLPHILHIRITLAHRHLPPEAPSQSTRPSFPVVALAFVASGPFSREFAFTSVRDDDQ